MRDQRTCFACVLNLLGRVDKKNSQDGLNVIRTGVLKLTKSTLNVRWKRHAAPKDTISEPKRAAVLRQTGNTSMCIGDHLGMRPVAGRIVRAS